jgi:hypothetical protein
MDDDIDQYLELVMDGFEIEDIIKFIEADLGIKCIKIKDKKRVLNKYNAST